jgi:hypothetical protein
MYLLASYRLVVLANNPTEKTMANIKKQVKRQIEFALRQKNLLLLNTMLASTQAWRKDFDASTINDDPGLRKKTSVLKRIISFIKSKLSSRSAKYKIMPKPPQPNLLNDLWRATNTTRTGKDCISHMQTYQWALKALLDSYDNTDDERTPNKKTTFSRYLALAHDKIALILKEEADKKKEEAASEANEQITIVVASDEREHDYEGGYDYSDSGDESDSPLISREPPPIIFHNAAKRWNISSKTKPADDITGESLIEIMTSVLTSFNKQQLTGGLSIAEIAEGNFQGHVSIAIVFIMKHLLPKIDPIICLPLVKNLCRLNNTAFPVMLSENFLGRLAQKVDGGLLSINPLSRYMAYYKTQKKLLAYQGVPKKEHKKKIKEAEKDARLLANLLKKKNVKRIIRFHSLNHGLALASDAYQCAETLSIASQLNAACKASKAGSIWASTRSKQRHLEDRLKAYLKQLQNIQTFQALGVLSNFKTSTDDNASLSTSCFSALNILANTLCLKIKALSDAIFRHTDDASKINQALDALNIPRSIITSDSQSELSTYVTHFFKKADKFRELEQETTEITETLFMNQAACFFLKTLQRNTGYRNYILGIPVDQETSKTGRLTLVNTANLDDQGSPLSMSLV